MEIKDALDGSLSMKRKTLTFLKLFDRSSKARTAAKSSRVEMIFLVRCCHSLITCSRTVLEKKNFSLTEPWSTYTAVMPKLPSELQFSKAASVKTCNRLSDMPELMIRGMSLTMRFMTQRNSSHMSLSRRSPGFLPQALAEIARRFVANNLLEETWLQTQKSHPCAGTHWLLKQVDLFDWLCSWLGCCHLTPGQNQRWLPEHRIAR